MDLNYGSQEVAVYRSSANNFFFEGIEVDDVFIHDPTNIDWFQLIPQNEQENYQDAVVLNNLYTRRSDENRASIDIYVDKAPVSIKAIAPKIRVENRNPVKEEHWTHRTVPPLMQNLQAVTVKELLENLASKEKILNYAHEYAVNFSQPNVEALYTQVQGILSAIPTEPPATSSLLFEHVRKVQPIPRSEEYKALLSEAVRTIESRRAEDIDEWAHNLVTASLDAND